MFRSRKSSSSKAEITSSLSSGNASIKRPAAISTTEEYQPNFNDKVESPHSYHEDIDENEIIDLQATPQVQQELTIESMSAVIAAAVQMSATGGAPSSLSIGSASILQPLSKTENKKETTGKRRFSVRLFSNSWKKSKPATSPSTPTTPSLEPSSPFDTTSSIDDDNSSQGSPRSSSLSGTSPMKFDDGRDELAYRGIQIKEIKTTLKTLVISDEERFPMPQIKLERPGFARINY